MDGLKLALIGNFDFTDTKCIFPILEKHIEKWISEQTFEVRSHYVEIVNTTDSGVSSLGPIYAEQHGHCRYTIPLRQSKFGSSAFWMRNDEIADRATHLLVFRKKKKELGHLEDLIKLMRSQDKTVIEYKIHKDGTVSLIEN